MNLVWNRSILSLKNLSQSWLQTAINNIAVVSLKIVWKIYANDLFNMRHKSEKKQSRLGEIKNFMFSYISLHTFKFNSIFELWKPMPTADQCVHTKKTNCYRERKKTCMNWSIRKPLAILCQCQQVLWFNLAFWMSFIFGFNSLTLICAEFITCDFEHEQLIRFMDFIKYTFGYFIFFIFWNRKYIGSLWICHKL